jgi:hypothetical protein
MVVVDGDHRITRFGGTLVRVAVIAPTLLMRRLFPWYHGDFLTLYLFLSCYSLLIIHYGVCLGFTHPSLPLRGSNSIQTDAD